MQNLKRNWLVQNWHEEFNKLWPKHTKISKIFPLLSCFWPKYIMLQLRKYKGVMFDGTEYWCKIWMKTDFCFQKLHEEFGKLSREHLKVSKLVLWWDSFIQSRKCISLKFTGEFFVMTMKKRCKIGRRIDLSFQNWHVRFNGLFLIKVYNATAKKLQKSYIWWHWRLMQNLKEIWSVLKWHQEFVKFSFTGWK